MKVPKPVRIASRMIGWVFLAAAVFSVWYWFAADYSYGAVSGAYVYRSDDVTSTLVLKADRSFLQEVRLQGKVQRTQGSWTRVGEGGIDFSHEFLAVGGIYPESDGFTHGEVQKSFLDLIPSVVLGADREHGPRFHRQFVRFF
jgi:hypothetical protein